ncbi:ABC transporter ATP-binding protein/permease [Nitrospinae bacterium]|nr:ABC transporter ATP-binding protein/permease [Nitrospinota bacterium]
MYYSAAIINSLLEGVSMLLLVNIFVGSSMVTDGNLLLDKIIDFINSQGFNHQFPDVIPLLTFLLGISFITRFTLLAFDGALGALLRQRIQETIFKSFLLGDWSQMRNFSVGDTVGTNTQESILVSRYLTSLIKAVYFILTALVMIALALLASYKTSLALGLITIPLMYLIRKMVGITASFSKVCSVLRNKFSGDITDRFNGLLQVHVDGNYDYHISQGLQVQGRLTRLEILTSLSQAVIGTFNVLLPITVLLGCSIWSHFFQDNSSLNLGLIASVGVLGLRAAAQLNGAVGQFGHIASLSGSLYPVLGALSVPPIPIKQTISEQIVRIEVNNISYTYGNNMVIKDVTLMAEKGVPLLLHGRSGKGKTTLANLMAGFYYPSTGKLLYVGSNGKKYDSFAYHPRVGFVTQDIYLFGGSLRNNLTAGRGRTDEQIWEALEQVDASEFVKNIGGLNTESAEAGRSLSGGQRRRLGIARVLLSGSDILIFDEATAGLDFENKTALLGLIEQLSKNYIVMIISHEKLSFSGQKLYSL